MAGAKPSTNRKQPQPPAESKVLLRAILDTAVDAIITIDQDGIVNDANPAVEKMFGYTVDELVGQNVRILMPPPYCDEHDEYITRYLETGVPRIIGIGRDLIGRRKDGSTFPIGLAVSEVDDSKRFAGVIRDITQRRELERQVIEAATDEQRRIGQDIHDGVGQEIAGLRYMAQTHAESLEQQASPDAKTAERMAQWLETIQRQLRAVIRELIPVEVHEKGLVAALRGIAERTTESHRVACVFECEKPIVVRDSAVAMHLYRIVQEAVSNAVRHAQAKRLAICLREASDVLTLKVSDDGVGIGSTPETNKGIGLRSMAYRAGLIGAHLKVENSEQGGTVIICVVPRGLPLERGQEYDSHPQRKEQ